MRVEYENLIIGRLAPRGARPHRSLLLLLLFSSAMVNFSWAIYALLSSPQLSPVCLFWPLSVIFQHLRQVTLPSLCEPLHTLFYTVVSHCQGYALRLFFPTSSRKQKNVRTTCLHASTHEHTNPSTALINIIITSDTLHTSIVLCPPRPDRILDLWVFFPSMLFWSSSHSLAVRWFRVLQ